MKPNNIFSEENILRAFKESTKDQRKVLKGRKSIYSRWGISGIIIYPYKKPKKDKSGYNKK